MGGPALVVAVAVAKQVGAPAWDTGGGGVLVVLDADAPPSRTDAAEGAQAVAEWREVGSPRSPRAECERAISGPPPFALNRADRSPVRDARRDVGSGAAIEITETAAVLLALASVVVLPALHLLAPRIRRLPFVPEHVCRNPPELPQLGGADLQPLAPVAALPARQRVISSG